MVDVIVYALTNNRKGDGHEKRKEEERKQMSKERRRRRGRNAALHLLRHSSRRRKENIIHPLSSREKKSWPSVHHFLGAFMQSGLAACAREMEVC